MKESRAQARQARMHILWGSVALFVVSLIAAVAIYVQVTTPPPPDETTLCPASVQ